jgi:hypothetical protein
MSFLSVLQEIAFRNGKQIADKFYHHVCWRNIAITLIDRVAQKPSRLALAQPLDF